MGFPRADRLLGGGLGMALLWGLTGPLRAQEATEITALRVIPEAEQQQLADLAGKNQQSEEVLTWLAQRGYSVPDVTTLLETCAQFNRPLGDVVAIKKFTGWTRKPAWDEVKALFSGTQQWGDQSDALWQKTDRPWNWEEIAQLLNRHQQGPLDLGILLDYRRVMTWPDLDTALSYAAQYGHPLGQLYEWNRQLNWDEIKALLDHEKAWGLPAETLLQLRIDWSWEELTKIQALAAQHQLPLAQVVQLRRKERLDNLTNLLHLGAQNKLPMEQIGDLWTQMRDVSEIQTLLNNAQAWKLPLEELKQFRQRMNWTHLTQVQNLANTHGLPFGEVFNLMVASHLDEVTTLLNNAQAWNLDRHFVKALRQWYTWTDLGQAVTQAQNLKVPLGEVLSFNKPPGPSPPAALQGLPKTLEQYQQWTGRAAEVWPLNQAPLEWTEVQNLLTHAQQGKGDLPTLLALRANWTWKDIDQILAYAQQFEQPAVKVAELGRTQEWGEVQNLLQNARQWGVDVETVVQWRREFTWEDLNNAVQNAPHFKVPREQLLDLRRRYDWSIITELLGLGPQYGQPWDRLLEWHQTRDVAEITTLLKNAQDWKIPPEELVRHRQAYNWNVLTQAQTLATQYSLPLATVLELRRQHNPDELAALLKNAQEWKLDCPLLTQLRTWLTWADIQQAVALTTQYHVPLEAVIAPRKTGQNWAEVEADLQPQP